MVFIGLSKFHVAIGPGFQRLLELKKKKKVNSIKGNIRVVLNMAEAA